MDAVMDLTARAVSFISLIQDTFLKATVSADEYKSSLSFNEVYNYEFANKFKDKIQLVKTKEEDIIAKNVGSERRGSQAGFENKVSELVGYSKQPFTENSKQAAEQYVIKLCEKLAEWLTANNKIIAKKARFLNAFSPPNVWREAISEIIYANATQRIDLAARLEYLPVHIILALGGGKCEAEEQRILQWWNTKNEDLPFGLSKEEHTLRENFKKSVYYKGHEKSQNNAIDPAVNNYYEEQVIGLLGNYQELKKALLNNNAPLSFEYVFTDELEEINEARKLRKAEFLLADSNINESRQISDRKNGTKSNGKPEGNGKYSNTHYSCDPFVRAKEMELFAVAFSGGGIRSATFNLGILQGLAKKGVISQVDYLSTVSGGGYIGSWLATWIRREGSVIKVADRLNPDKSADPMGEEVRPVRWLRMFSNYFTPNKSIMSIDSWTVGVTWIRNMLLNQLIILLLLLTLFLFGNIIFEFWRFPKIWSGSNTGFIVLLWSGLTLVVSVLAGLGMQAYHNKRFVSLTKSQTNYVIKVLISLVFIGAFLISAWLFSNKEDIKHDSFFWNLFERIKSLWMPAVTTFISLLVIAYQGGYQSCIRSYNSNDNKKSAAKKAFEAIKPPFLIIYTALMSAIAGTVCLAIAWQFFNSINTAFFAKILLPRFGEAVAFTIGVPIVLLVFGITVVVRMALLGIYFPDERREWWGRMGAVINELAFVWLLIAGAALIGRDIADGLLSKLGSSVTLTAWLAFVGSAVKAAYSPKTNGTGETKGIQSTILNILAQAGPYLFILGLLIYLPALINPLKHGGLQLLHLVKNLFIIINEKINLPVPVFTEESKNIINLAVLTIILAITTWRLAKKVGVNEFSMHHFYRNRLVRAYLGATRRKASREKTANPFTGFDMLDDEKLSAFKHTQGYYGPYPILNTALNASQVTDLSRQDRKAESFIFSPLYCGFDFSRIRASVNVLTKSYDYGFRQTEEYAYPNDKGPGIGTAMAISGAAVNPNQGYHSSAGIAFFLTVFNLQMGWWTGNPRKNKWKQSDPDFGIGYLIYNLTGQTNTRNEFVCLSDGGHFDNMGLYELVRRKCRLIILGDSEQDENFTCEGFANAIRRCRIDFGAEIEINIDNIVKRKNRCSGEHYSVGKIKYNGESVATGTILYIKSSITGKEPVDVIEYYSNNKTFPHQTTADQFFNEEQFESYRRLGMHIADLAMCDRKVLKALNLKLEAKPENEDLITILEKPVKVIASKFRNLFLNRNGKN